MVPDRMEHYKMGWDGIEWDWTGRDRTGWNIFDSVSVTQGWEGEQLGTMLSG